MHFFFILLLCGLEYLVSDHTPFKRNFAFIFFFSLRYRLFVVGTFAYAIDSQQQKGVISSDSCYELPTAAVGIKLVGYINNKSGKMCGY